MLKKIVIKNFQRHKHRSIILDKRLTIIVGKNDKGKSAIIRAIRWCLLNVPAGRGFVRRNSKTSSVTIKCDSRTIEKRIGWKAGGTYQLEGKKYKAFGRKVPPAISNLAAVDAINFQRQTEQFSWFKHTPGQVAKELNSLVDLESIDKMQVDLTKQLRKKKSELEVSRERLKEAKQSKRTARPLAGLHVKLDKLLSRQNDIALESHTIDSLALLVGAAMEADTTHQTTASGAAAACNVGAAMGAAMGAANRVATLAGLLAAIRSARYHTTTKIPDTKSLSTMLMLVDRRKELKVLLDEFKEKEKELCQCHERIKNKRTKLEKAMGGRCPTCGGLLTDKSLI